MSQVKSKNRSKIVGFSQIDKLKLFGLKAMLGVVKVFLNKNPNIPVVKLRKHMERVLSFYNFSAMNSKFPISIGRMNAEWVIGERCVQNKIILYLHGGAYCLGSCNTHRSLVNRIVEQSQIKALMIDYALAPEFPYPHGLNDALGAYRWLIQQGYSGEQIVLMGDSAGGGLALSLYLSLEENNLPKPASIVCLSPWADLACTRSSFKRNGKKDMIVGHGIATRLAACYTGNESILNPKISPIYGDFNGCPPILIQTSLSEVLYDDSKDLTQVLESQGVSVELQEWEGMPHVWQIFADRLPEGQDAIRKIGKFVRKSLSLDPLKVSLTRTKRSVFKRGLSGIFD